MSTTHRSPWWGSSLPDNRNWFSIDTSLLLEDKCLPPMLNDRLKWTEDLMNLNFINIWMCGLSKTTTHVACVLESSFQRSIHKLFNIFSVDCLLMFCNLYEFYACCTVYICISVLSPFIALKILLFFLVTNKDANCPPKLGSLVQYMPYTYQLIVLYSPGGILQMCGVSLRDI